MVLEFSKIRVVTLQPATESAQNTLHAPTCLTRRSNFDLRCALLDLEPASGLFKKTTYVDQICSMRPMLKIFRLTLFASTKDGLRILCFV